MLRGLHALPADGEGHITHIKVAARIRRDPVGGDELRWPFAFLGLANAGLQMPLEVVDADAMAQARGIVNTALAVEFADKDRCLGSPRRASAAPRGRIYARGYCHSRPRRTDAP